ncbi:MAG: hypothetical protein PUC09_00680, partial [Methanobrevibacter wolinii]|nr:hypothetical protein [Methanobrevibacter wolinii]
MKKINSIYLILSLFALLLLIGAVSAADVDNSTADTNSFSVDDSSATSINEVQTSNSEVNDVQSVNESNVYSDSEKTVDNWANLKDTVESSNDNVNSNITYTADNISTANGCGGAISTSAGGYFDVHGSTFVHNSAKIGQAIYASNVGYDGNGTPYLKIYNNTFINHTSNSNDTVYIPNGN